MNLEIVLSVSRMVKFTQPRTSTSVATNPSNVKFAISAQIQKVIASLSMEKLSHSYFNYRYLFSDGSGTRILISGAME